MWSTGIVSNVLYLALFWGQLSYLLFCKGLNIPSLFSFGIFIFFSFSPNQRLLAVSLLDSTVKVFFADTLKVSQVTCKPWMGCLQLTLLKAFHKKILLYLVKYIIQYILVKLKTFFFHVIRIWDVRWKVLLIFLFRRFVLCLPYILYIVNLEVHLFHSKIFCNSLIFSIVFPVFVWP